MCGATSHYVVNRDNFNSESKSKFAALLMVLGRARNVQDPEICCGLLLNICVSFCSYHCFIYIYIYIYICVCVCVCVVFIIAWSLLKFRNTETTQRITVVLTPIERETLLYLHISQMLKVSTFGNIADINAIVHLVPNACTHIMSTRNETAY